MRVALTSAASWPGNIPNEVLSIRSCRFQCLSNAVVPGQDLTSLRRLRAESPAARRLPPRSCGKKGFSAAASNVIGCWDGRHLRCPPTFKAPGWCRCRACAWPAHRPRRAQAHDVVGLCGAAPKRGAPVDTAFLKPKEKLALLPSATGWLTAH